MLADTAHQHIVRSGTCDVCTTSQHKCTISPVKCRSTPAMPSSWSCCPNLTLPLQAAAEDAAQSRKDLHLGHTAFKALIEMGGASAQVTFMPDSHWHKHSAGSSKQRVRLKLPGEGGSSWCKPAASPTVGITASKPHPHKHTSLSCSQILWWHELLGLPQLGREELQCRLYRAGGLF